MVRFGLAFIGAFRAMVRLIWQETSTESSAGIFPSRFNFSIRVSSLPIFAFSGTGTLDCRTWVISSRVLGHGLDYASRGTIAILSDQTSWKA